MLYKIRWNPVHPLNGTLPGPYVPARVTRSALVAHRYTYAPPRCRTSQCSRTFIPTLVSLWNDLANHVFDGVVLAGFKSRDQCLVYLNCSIPTIVFYYFSLSFLFVYMFVFWGFSLRTDRVYITLSQPCTADLFLIIIIIIIIIIKSDFHLLFLFYLEISSCYCDFRSRIWDYWDHAASIRCCLPLPYLGLLKSCSFDSVPSFAPVSGIAEIMQLRFGAIFRNTSIFVGCGSHFLWISFTINLTIHFQRIEL